jgi:conjugative transfer region lipoprotein (TIGR03751 family)
MQSKIQMLIACTSISLVLGCASDSTSSILPQEGPTMKQVYDSQFSGAPLAKRKDENDETDNQDDDKTNSEHDERIARRPHQADYDLIGYTREAGNEIKQLFPRLSNPTLVLYIYPHLAGAERHPVPGYSTAFTLYEKVEYALPGEREEKY